ncbi:MAG TPA: hypothetical protein VLE74_04095 [Candidatus Saccharimonadales bacterium]|nr:hypothetical protein [Candidatus Saccharimonadales bacterium]
MPRNFDPSDRPGFVHPGETPDSAELMRQHRVANYLARATDLRSDVYEKLRTSGALSEHLGWAVFDIELDALPADGISDPVNHKEVALLYYNFPSPTAGGDRLIPVIRILSREAIRSPEGIGFLNYDFSLDKDHDAQYLVGSYTPMSNVEDMYRQLSHLPPDDRPPRTDPESYIPVFYMEEGTLRFMQKLGCAAFAHRVPGEVNGEKREVVPFGDWTGIDDKLDALSVGETLFDEIANREPSHHSSVV